MAEAQIMSLTPEQLGVIMQDAGYRTEHRNDNNGTPLIASATGGVSFNVRMGNRAVPPAEGYLDFTYLTVIKIEGDFPIERTNDWNRNKRFARLHNVVAWRLQMAPNHPRSGRMGVRAVHSCIPVFGPSFV